MAESMTGPITRCPWCSAALPSAQAETCHACGATLTSATGAEPQLPGVTTLDAEAILRARSDAGRSRSRILSFITGDVPEETGDQPASAGSLAPPSGSVRREMLRLEYEAEKARLEAEAVALKVDAVLEGHAVPAPEVGDAPAGAADDADATSPEA